MNLNGRSSLDPRWNAHHVRTVRGFMRAKILIVRKDADVAPTYNQQTQTWTGAFTTVYEGWARVQPYGIIGDQIVAQDTTGRRLMRVQIETKTSDVNLDDMLSVTWCPQNPELQTFTMEVRGTIGSSNEWLTDLVCEADLKRVVPDAQP